MAEKSCDNCMTRRKGDCWGGGLCSAYKPGPTISKTELDNWPVVMRSNSQSRHMEWMKQQREYTRQSEKTRKPVQRLDLYSVSKLDVDRKGVAAYVEGFNTSDDLTTIQDIRSEYQDDIIIWLSVIEAGNKLYKCKYMLEWNGHKLADDAGLAET